MGTSKERDVRLDAIDEAVTEAQRFLHRAREVRKRLQSCPGWQPLPQWAATKRASMDLTRSLARLRRTGPWTVPR